MSILNRNYLDAPSSPPQAPEPAVRGENPPVLVVEKPFELDAAPAPAADPRRGTSKREQGQPVGSQREVDPSCRAHLPPLAGPPRPWGPEDVSDEYCPLDDPTYPYIDGSLPAVDDGGPPKPKQVAAPCSCGSPFFWGAIDGRLFCAECVPIPSRAFASGGAWKCVVEDNGTTRWQDWEPVGWQPFAHIEQEEAAAEAKRLAEMPVEDF